MAVGKGETMENTENVENIDTQEIEANVLEELRDKARKYDMAAADYQRIRDLAAHKDCSVGEFISGIEKDMTDRRIEELTEGCGGNRELAERIFKLESAAAGIERADIREISEYFPEITEISQLPETVVEASRLKGSALLDEYLRHLAQLYRAKENSAQNDRRAKDSSIGSQRNAESGDYDPTSREFIKALWSR